MSVLKGSLYREVEMMKKRHGRNCPRFSVRSGAACDSAVSEDLWQSTLSRRRFLKTAALASLSSFLWDWRAAFAKPEKGSILVVGAGMAGVSAARELQSRGFTVTVLEARSRLGGRIWSNRSLGAVIDLGASWIQESEGNPMTQLAKKFAVKTKATGYDDVEVYDYAAKTKNDFMGFLNMNKYGSGPILVVFTGGSFARSLEDQADSGIIKDVMKVLRTIYGKNFPNRSSHVITRWMKDTFAGGSYSYVRVGSKTQDYDALMQSLKNRVFFAGEATIRDYPGTVHGAFLSGLREARRIAKL